MKHYFGFALKPGEDANDLFGTRTRIPLHCLAPSTRDKIKFSWHLVMSVSSIFALLFTFRISSEPSKYLIYLTSWDLVTAALGFTLQLWHSWSQLRSNSQSMQTRPMLTGLEAVITVLLNIVLSTSFVITIFYWFVLYPRLDEDNRQSRWDDKILGHGLIFTLAFTDTCFFSTRPIRWQHFYQPLAFGLVWCLFSVLYYLSGGTGYRRHHPSYPNTAHGNQYIYKQVDWSNPWMTLLFCFFIAMLLIFVHIFFSALNVFMTKLCKSSSLNLHQNDEQTVNSDESLSLNADEKV